MSRKQTILAILAIHLFLLPRGVAAESVGALDILLRNGMIHVGDGQPGENGDVAIRDGRIVAVGHFKAGKVKHEVDCSGLVVCPGFIDLHNHSDRQVLEKSTRSLMCYVTQGCTTIVTGNCGSGPINVADYYDQIDQYGVGVNVAHLLPQGALREEVVGSAQRNARRDELERMMQLADQAMKDGAWGMTTGLIYVPSSYADTEELVEIASVVGRHGGIYASHIRNENVELLSAVEEALEIGDLANVPVHISHFKSSGKNSWGLVRVASKMIEQARDKGRRITADQYPYTASNTSLQAMLIPPWARAGGQDQLIQRFDAADTKQRIRAAMAEKLVEVDDGQRLQIASYETEPSWSGRRLAEIARDRSMSSIDLAVEIIRNGGASVVNHSINEEDVRYVMSLPWVAAASDGSAKLPGATVPHPRSYGTFPRKIGHYSRSENVVPLEHAIRSCTGLPADILGMSDRGYLRADYWADIVVFDPARIRDTATFVDPHNYSTGIEHVFVNGEPALSRGAATGMLMGRALRHVSTTIEPVNDYESVTSTLADVITEQMAQKRLPALSIALVADDQLVWAQGFGQAESDRPATAETVYRVGSLSKLITDVALMQLVDGGKADLDAPVRDYLEDFQPNSETTTPITLRQLVSHRSGLVREPPIGHYFDPDEPTLAETVHSLNGTDLVYPPETKTKYSNAAVAVVGRVIEELTDQPFELFVEKSVFNKLSMNDSSFDPARVDSSKLAKGQMWSYDAREFAAPTFKLGTSAAGNLYSNVTDLAKFSLAIINGGRGAHGRILSEQDLVSMMKPQFDASAPFGIGFHLSELDGHRVIGHGGAVYGFSTQIKILPDKRVAVIAATSRDVSNGIVSRVAEYALRCLLAKQEKNPLPEFATSQPLPPERARRLDGLYANDEQQTVRLTERNGRLFMTGYGQYRREIRARGAGLVVDDRFGSGPVLSNATDQSFVIDGQTYARQADGIPPTLPQPMQGLVGQYGWDHNELFIFERGGRLQCVIEWVFRYPLTAVEKDVYAFPDYGLYHGEQIIFQRDEQGTAERAIVAGMAFPRRQIGMPDGKTFRIEAVKPMDELRQIALTATPPEETGSFRESDLVEITKLDDSIKLDIRYASTNNFVGEVFYRQPRAFLQRPAAEAVVEAHQNLNKLGYGLLIHDAYRPWFVTKMFWDATPPDKKIFVANPATGSRHNRGCAVDLTLYDLATGDPIDMGAGYDEFSPRSFPDYEVASSRARWHRELLRDAMERVGFTIYEYEWWHFDYQDWNSYAIQNVTFENVGP